MDEKEIILSPAVHTFMDDPKLSIPIMKLIVRFLHGDWGYITERQQRVNEQVSRTQKTLLNWHLFSKLLPQRSIFASYTDLIPLKKSFIWIIENRTASGRSKITVMIPEEYGWYSEQDNRKEA